MNRGYEAVYLNVKTRSFTGVNLWFRAVRGKGDTPHKHGAQGRARGLANPFIRGTRT